MAEQFVPGRVCLSRSAIKLSQRGPNPARHRSQREHPWAPPASSPGNRGPLKLPQASEEIAALLHMAAEGTREVAGGAAARGLVLLTHGECPHFHRRPVTLIVCSSRDPRFHRFGHLSACCRQFDSDTVANPRGEVTVTSPRTLARTSTFPCSQTCREH